MFSTAFNKNAPSERLNFTDWLSACPRLPCLRLRVRGLLSGPLWSEIHSEPD
jgi:hypothetical protein